MLSWPCLPYVCVVILYSNCPLPAVSAPAPSGWFTFFPRMFPPGFKSHVFHSPFLPWGWREGWPKPHRNQSGDGQKLLSRLAQGDTLDTRPKDLFFFALECDFLFWKAKIAAKRPGPALETWPGRSWILRCIHLSPKSFARSMTWKPCGRPPRCPMSQGLG